MKQMGKEKQKIGLGMIVLGVVAVLLIIRAHYGMDVTDETMYLSIAKRFAEGDSLNNFMQIINPNTIWISKLFLQKQHYRHIFI